MAQQSSNPIIDVVDRPDPRPAWFLTHRKSAASKLPCSGAWSRSVLLLGLAVALHGPAARAVESGDTPPRHRTVVLTDIEADPDDTQTLVRLLLYSNVIDIEGLVATTSVHQKTMVARNRSAG